VVWYVHEVGTNLQEQLEGITVPLLCGDVRRRVPFVVWRVILQLVF